MPWHWLDVSVSFTLSNVALYTPSCQPHFSSRTVDWPSTPRGRGAPLSSLTTEATTNTPPLGVVESSAAWRRLRDSPSADDDEDEDEDDEEEEEDGSSSGGTTR